MSLKIHLQAHQRKSTGGRLNLQCEHPECGKRFTDNFRLERHENIHRNNLRKCFFCPWAGAEERDALIHSDKHLLNARYKCSDCGKKFYKKESLTLHFEGQHEKIEKKYSCKLCSFQTHAKYLLKCHVQRKHCKLADYDKN